MTAKEMLNKRKFNPDEPITLSESEVEDLMNEFVLHIGEQAVGAVCEENPYKKLGDRESYSQYREGVEAGADAVLSRIKKLTAGK